MIGRRKREYHQGLFQRTQIRAFLACFFPSCRMWRRCVWLLMTLSHHVRIWWLHVWSFRALGDSMYEMCGGGGGRVVGNGFIYHNCKPPPTLNVNLIFLISFLVNISGHYLFTMLQKLSLIKWNFHPNSNHTWEHYITEMLGYRSYQSLLQ